MLTLHDNMDSGNGYKMRLLLHKLAVPYARVELDIDRGETRTAQFLVKNPNGRIPTLELEDGTCLAESNAIIHYLAEGSPYLPADRLKHAQVLQWMFFEQYSHEPYIAVARFWLHLVKGGRELKKNQIDEWMDRGYQALGVMERHLASEPYFGGDHFTIADIALYGYTHVAGDGDFDLSHYPQIGRWLERVESEPGHVDITWRPPA